MFTVNGKKKICLFAICLLPVSTNAASSATRQEPIVANAANITADQLVSWVLARNPGL